MMQAVILAGGAGTRLQDLYPGIMKALVPVNGRPFVEWQIAWLREAGIQNIHLAGGLYSEQLKAWYDAQSLFKNLTYSIEPSQLGTGGGLAYALSKMPPGPTFCVNGDSLLPNISLNNMYTRLHATSLKAIIAVTAIDNAARFGTIRSENGYVTHFEEKKKPGPGIINGGVYLVRENVFDQASPESSFSIERETFPVLASRHELGCIEAEPPLMDMGTPEGLAEMSAWLENNDLLAKSGQR
jgi:NDP-sugar pyrophosphorylase family protein